MKVIVGSSDIELSPDIVYSIAAILATLEPDEGTAIRTNSEGYPASALERLVRSVSARMGRECREFSPTKGGRAAVFHRDYDMVDEATSVHAYFSVGREMSGGTSHVVKAALDRGSEVEAWGMDPSGTLRLIGSQERSDESFERKIEQIHSSVLYQMLEEHGE